MFQKYINFFKDWSNQTKYAKWLIKYTKPYIPSLVLMMGFSLITSLISVGMAIIGKYIIDGATAGNNIFTGIVLYVIIIFTMQIISVISSLLSVVINEKFSFGIRKQVYERILNTCLEDISNYHTGDLMTRLTSDTSTIASGISTTLPSIITLVVELVTTFFTLLYYDATLAIFAVILAPVAVFSSAFLGKKLKVLQVKVQESESNYRSFIQESLSNIMIIKTFCQEDYSSNKLTELRNERLHWVLKKNRMSLAASTAMNCTFQIGYIVAFAWGAFKLSTKSITYGTMSVFLTLVNRIQAPILNLATTVPQVVSILASAGRVIELQNLPEEVKQEEHLQPENIGVTVSNLTFGYQKDLIFQDTDLSITPGEFVAIVGESGIGKTTLIRLMLSFISTGQGSIEFFNQRGETELTNGGSRAFMSYVPQGNTLFSGTIAHNVRMGNPDATDDEVITALKNACAYNFVMEFPDGIYTEIGERGHGLSEGQAQRIAIARALIRKAPFLILDEATSSLDEKTELNVLESIRNFTPSPTCILITHRRSVLAYCDRELRIEDKKIIPIN